MLALVLVKRRGDHLAIRDVNIGLRRVRQPGECMLHPFLVVTLFDV